MIEQQRDCTCCHWTVHLKMVKTTNLFHIYFTIIKTNKQGVTPSFNQPGGDATS